MKKILFIGSTENMTEYAKNYIKKTKRKDTKAVFLPAKNMDYAREYVAASSAQILIARGALASEMKRYTDRSVVEIVITAQELGLLIKQAKDVIKKERPTIAVVGLHKMFCDMRDFDRIFDINLITVFFDNLEALPAGVDEAVSRGAELIIGGNIVCDYAEKYGIPHILQPDGSDSIEQAFRIADSVAWAADMEKKNAVELKALLDYSSNGIMKINKDGIITSLNDQVLSLLDSTREEVEGRNFRSILHLRESAKVYEDVFIEGQESFFTFWHATGSALAVNVAPLLVDKTIEGAILSFHVINKLRQIEADARRELYQNQSIQEGDYDWFSNLFSENKSFINAAKKLAQYDECVLLSGSHPAERELIARYMHDVSLRRDKPFVYVTGDMYNDLQTSDNMSEGVIHFTEAGTYFIDNIEILSAQSQYNLFRLLSDGLFSKYTNASNYNVQFILGSPENLFEAVESGHFREDLYYIVSALALDVPYLENCPNEIRNWLNHYLEQYSEMYSAYVHITKSARSAIMTHPWKGGIAELRSFCCNAVINAPKKVLDESTVMRFLRKNNMYAAKEPPLKALGFNANPEVAKLKFLIEKYDGNRGLIADEMHISLTTLWRRLKKYGLL